MAQTYTDPVARERMAKGLCPECGHEPGLHGGWGGPGCSLTDNGVAQRVAQFQKEEDQHVNHVEGPLGFTETFDDHMVDVLLNGLGLIKHVEDRHVTVARVDGVDVPHGPIHRFYEQANQKEKP